MSYSGFDELVLNHVPCNKRHWYQSRYKKKLKPKGWWDRTSKIQAFRRKNKLQYKHNFQYVIENLLPELKPQLQDYLSHSQNHYKTLFKKCIREINYLCVSSIRYYKIFCQDGYSEMEVSYHFDNKDERLYIFNENDWKRLYPHLKKTNIILS